MDWIWILILVLLHVCFLVINLRLLFYFEHPDDSKYNQGLLAKVVIILGLQLAWLTISLLPVDAHVATIESGVNILTFWEIVFLFLVLFLVIPLPVAVFYYEADSDPRVTKTPPWKKTLFYEIIVLVGAGTFLGVGYAIMSAANVPRSEINCDNNYLPSSLSAVCGSSSSNREGKVDVTTPYLIYEVSLSAFVGWWGFVLFAGVGLSALPVSLIVDFVDRPSAIDFETYSEKKKLLGEKAGFLRSCGEGLKSSKLEAATAPGFGGHRQRLALERDARKFKQSVHLLEEEYKKLLVAYNERGENPVISYSKLIAGILCAVASTLWLVQIILAIIVPQVSGVTLWNFDDFLILVNKVEFFALDLGVYGGMVLYLMVAALVGCFRYGLRVFLCFAIMPMKKGDTHLNRFLINVTVMVLAGAAAAHFSVVAFPKYTQNTAADLIFFHYAQNQRILSIFFRYHIFVWALLIWSFICLIYYIFRPREKAAVSQLNFQAVPGSLAQHGEAEPGAGSSEPAATQVPNPSKKKKANRIW